MTTRSTPATLARVKWTFLTVAEMQAEAKLRSGDTCQTYGYATVGDGGGAFYRVVTSSATANGSTVIALDNTALRAELVIVERSKPQQYGAVAGGTVAAHVALQAWIDDTINRAGDTVGFFKPRVVLDFGGYVFGIGRPLTFPNIRNLVVQNAHLVAIGGLWTVDDYMLDNSSDWSTFQNVTLDCNKLANGVKDVGGRNRWDNLRVVRMTPNWTSRGFWKPSVGSGDTRISQAWISQWVTADTEFSDASKFTAELVRIDDSDCKVHDSNLNWGAVCYVGNNGVHLLYNTHLVNGREGLASSNPALATNTRLIEWAKDGTGEITLANVYLDNGQCDFYNDRVNLDVIMLSDTADSILTDGMLRFHASAASDDLRASGTIRFVQWNSTYEMLKLKNRGSNSWSADSIALAATVSGRVTEDSAQDVAVQLNRRRVHASFSGGTQGESFYGNHGIGFNGPGATFAARSSEPAMLPNGSLARSDGTSSTNGFGGSGAGIYEKRSGVWARLNTA